MSTNKNRSLAIGAFIVGAVLLVFIALLFFSGGRLFTDKERVVMFFDGSVQGLQTGAPIKLKGVVLGEIKDIQINFQNDKTVVTAVTADLEMKRISSKGNEVTSDFLPAAIQNGLRAQLNFQSFLTGLLYVELDFYPESELKLYKLQDDYPEIPTIGTSLEAISRNLQELDAKELVNNINELAAQINEIVTSGQIQRTLDSFEHAANAVSNTAGSVDTELAQLSEKLDKNLNQMEKLLAQLNQQTPVLANSLNKSLITLNDSLLSFNKTTTSLGDTFSEDAPLVNQLSTTLEDISRSAQAFRNLSETLEQQPESLLRGRRIDGDNGDD